MGEMIEFARPDGSQCKGYFASAGAGKPAVIVIQEWWGLNPQICKMADRFAAAGFTALAPDLYHGRVTQDPDEAGHLMNGLDFPGATHQDIRGAVLHLAKTAPKVGVTGFCMGGRLAFLTAAALPDQVAAAAPFYGGGIVNHLGQASAIKAPMLLFFADKDGFIPLDQVQAVDAKLKELGKDYRIKRYANADHGFFCNHRASYNEASAKDAWGELKTFLARHLAA